MRAMENKMGGKQYEKKNCALRVYICHYLESRSNSNKYNHRPLFEMEKEEKKRIKEQKANKKQIKTRNRIRQSKSQLRKK